MDEAKKREDQLRILEAQFDLEEERREALRHWREEIEREKEIAEGKIYGEEFHRYTIEDIEKISDTTFLYDMFHAVTPKAQPMNSDEWDILNELLDAITKRIRQLEISF